MRTPAFDSFAARAAERLAERWRVVCDGCSYRSQLSNNSHKVWIRRADHEQRTGHRATIEHHHADGTIEYLTPRRQLVEQAPLWP
jgi:phage terminase large subunit GpA-like protein